MKQSNMTFNQKMKYEHIHAYTMKTKLSSNIDMTAGQFFVCLFTYKHFYCNICLSGQLLGSKTQQTRLHPSQHPLHTNTDRMSLLGYWDTLVYWS